MGRDSHKKKQRYRSRSRSPKRSYKYEERRRKERRFSNSRSRSRSPQNDDKALRYKEEQRKMKTLLKSVETPEEKRARRLAKKEAKERKRKAEMGWDEEDLGYTNSNNPFGDHNLRETFTWRKKNEVVGLKNAEEQQRFQKQKQDEMKVELQKVKQRRLEREREKAARDEEMTMMQREKEAAMFEEWEKQEDEFHLQQARKRSKLRIKDGRAKPIDLLAEYVNPAEEDFELQMNEPYSILVGLGIDDLEDLIEDIKVYKQLEQGQNAEFWKDMTIVTKNELEELKVKRQEGDLRNQREVINTAVKADVASIFKGKTHSQLVAMQKQITNKINAGGAIDIGYWESLLQQLKAYIARARLRERHQSKLRQKLDELKNQHDEDSDSDSVQNPIKIEKAESPQPGHSQQKTENVEDEANVESKVSVEEPNASMEDNERLLPKLSEEEMAVEAYATYEDGSYSPRLIPFQDVDETKWVDPDDDIHRLGFLRIQVKSGSSVEEEEVADKVYSSEATKILGEGEEAFNVPFNIAKKTYSWTDKYRPRKPRFFNRVHTGYEWNKYNQTHYDTDNPPPKIVQGYKFNIFYPDLIDKTKAPEYSLTPIKEDPEFAVLRFSGGPPYEDIAFKVVNREWELAHKHGFRCQFQNNVFQLWFHFKRYRYRR